MRSVLLILAVLWMSAPFAHDGAGVYQGVIESELELFLSLDPSGTAEMTYTVHAVEDEEVERRGERNGVWTRQGAVVRVTLGETRVEYEIEPCLSYSAFGAKGCSAGLRPIFASGPDEWLERYSLWERSSLSVPVAATPN